MARFEIRMEALPLNEEEVKVLREKAAKYRREKDAYSHQQILKEVSKHALSLTPPREHSYSSAKSPEITPAHMVPIDDPSSCMPRKVVFNNPKSSNKKKTAAAKKGKVKQQMPTTKIGVMSTPKPLSPINTEPAPAPPPLSYKEWKMRQTKSLPKVWKQTDIPPACSESFSDRSFDDSEDEELIELPESLTEREAMVQAAQKTNDDNEVPKLIPVGHSKSFEKWHLHETPSTTSATTAPSLSTKSPSSSSVSSSASSTLPPPSSFPVTELSSSGSYNSTTSSTQTPSPLRSRNNSSSNESDVEAEAPPPCLIVPKTINALSANNIGQVYITDKISDLDKLVLATAFSPVPVSTLKPKFAGKSKSDFAIHHVKAVTFIKKSKEEAAAAASKKFPPDRNIDVCKQYEIVKAARFPNAWIDEMEAIAVIIFLLAVIALLLYRSAFAVVSAAAAV